tara:strand:+ start:3851 stop:4414 length:564 start_codon:yes stop_codon:yes gene_type:complete
MESLCIIGGVNLVGIINAIDDETLYNLAKRVGLALTQQGLVLVSAESCTGGWLGQIVTSIPGSSAWYQNGFITYTAKSKQELLGISTKTIKKYGEVSEETAREMAHGAAIRSRAQAAVSITGIAGPGGGTMNKPVGMVCFAWEIKDNHTQSATRHFSGDRKAVRQQAVAVAMQGLIDLLRDTNYSVA